MNKFAILKHWTPRYLWNRFKLFIFESLHRSLPWLTKSAIEFLDDFLKQSDSGVEFGSGRSTLWLSQRVEHLTSIEHCEKWYNKVNGLLAKKGIKNVKAILSHREEKFDEEDQDSNYAKILDTFADGSLDFVLVDGIYRGSCACKAIEKVRPGGIIIVDNVERYIAMQTFSPEAIEDANKMKATWKTFRQETKSWRLFYTTNGVTDTAFFFKPPPQ